MPFPGLIIGAMDARRLHKSSIKRGKMTAAEARLFKALNAVIVSEMDMLRDDLVQSLSGIDSTLSVIAKEIIRHYRRKEREAKKRLQAVAPAAEGSYNEKITPGVRR